MPKAVKSVDEPNAVNRLLMSDVTASWPRTLRAVVILFFLAVLLGAGAVAAIIAGNSVASPLLRSITGS